MATTVSNQTAYLNSLVSSGTAGQAAWAKEQLKNVAASAATPTAAAPTAPAPAPAPTSTPSGGGGSSSGKSNSPTPALAPAPAPSTPTQTTTSYNGGYITIDPGTDYQALINAAVAKGDYTAAAQAEAQRNAKLISQGLKDQTTTNYVSVYNNGTPNNQGGTIYANTVNNLKDLPTGWTTATVNGINYTQDANGINQQTGGNATGAIYSQVGNKINPTTGELMWTNPADAANEAYRQYLMSGGDSKVTKDYAIQNLIDPSYVYALGGGTAADWTTSVRTNGSSAGLPTYAAPLTTAGGVPINATTPTGGATVPGMTQGPATDVTNKAGQGGGGSLSGIGGGTTSALIAKMYDDAIKAKSDMNQYATDKGVSDLQAALEQSKKSSQVQRDQNAINSAYAQNTSALRSALLGDQGGIGQKQYNEIGNARDKRALEINLAQAQIESDTNRQIADLRAQGKYKEADIVATLGAQKIEALLNESRYQEELALKQQEQAKQQWIDTIGAYSGDYQAQINKIANDGDPSNDWMIPYLQAARQQKLAGIEEAAAKAQQNAIDNQLAWARINNSGSGGGGTDTSKPYGLSLYEAQQLYNEFGEEAGPNVTATLNYFKGISNEPEPTIPEAGAVPVKVSTLSSDYESGKFGTVGSAQAIQMFNTQLLPTGYYFNAAQNAIVERPER